MQEIDYKSIGTYLKDIVTKTNNNETTDADGGYAVGLQIQDAIVANLAFEGILWDKAKKIVIVTGNGAKVPYGTDPLAYESSTGVRAYWVDEAAQSTSQALTFGAANIELGKLVVRVPVTNELDWDVVNLAQYVIQVATRAIVYKVEREMLFGVGKSVKGVAGDGSSATAEVTIAGECPTEAELMAMIDKIHPVSSKDATFYISKEIETRLKSIAYTNDNAMVLQGNDMYLFGYPVKIMSALTNSPYQIILGDFTQYCLVMRKMRIDKSEHVRFLEGENEYRISLRVGGDVVAAKTVMDDGNTYSYFVTGNAVYAFESSSSTSSSSESSESGGNNSSSSSLIEQSDSSSSSTSGSSESTSSESWDD